MSGDSSVVLGAIALALRLIVAAVFAIAGIAKMRDIAGTKQMLRDFGLPRAAAEPLGWLLPATELAVAAALVSTLSAHWGALAAVCLLGAFTVAIIVNLMLGRTPECRCFGQVASKPIGAATIVRNLIVLGAAALVAAESSLQSDARLFAWLEANLAVALIAIVVLSFLAMQTFLMVQILRQQGRMLLRLDTLDSLGLDSRAMSLNGHSNGAAAPAGLPVGSPAPLFDLPSVGGERVSLKSLLGSGKRVVLFIAHPACGPCGALLPQMARWEAELGDRLTFAVISEGSIRENRRFIAEHGLQHVLLQKGQSVSNTYAAYGTPSALFVEPDGRIGSEVAAGADAIRQLISSIVPPAMRGQQAPNLSARTADGNEVRLVQFRGRDVALLFWNANCGFCKATASDLVAWDRQSVGQLVVVSPAVDEDLVTRGLRSPILIDEAGTISRSFGAAGTPMAVRINAEGIIASDIAAGKDAVLGLLRDLPNREQTIVPEPA